MKIDLSLLAPVIKAAAPAEYRPLLDAAINAVNERIEREKKMHQSINALIDSVNAAHERITELGRSLAALNERFNQHVAN